MLKILIVDDEILVRIGIRSFLSWEEYGFQIQAEASDGREALDLCKQNPPDVIFTDIRMPVMDGLELIETVKQLYPEIRLIVLSCLDEADYVKKSMLAGACGFFTKISLSQEQIIPLLKRLRKEILSTKERTEELQRLKGYVTAHKLSFNRQFMEHMIGLSSVQARQTYALELAKASGVSDLLDLNRFLAIRICHWHAISDQQTFAYNLFHYLSTLLPHIVTKYELIPCRQLFFIAYRSQKPGMDAQLEAVLRNGLKTYFNIDCEVVPFLEPSCSIYHLPDYYQTLILSSQAAASDTKQCPLSLDAITKAVEKGDTETALNALSQLKNCPLSTWKFKNTMIELLFQYEKCFRRYDESMDNYFDQSFVNSIIDTEDKEELYNKMYLLTGQLPDILMKFRENQYGDVISAVTAHIDLHYKERLTLDYAASLAGLNSSYFSRLFKKHAGMGFVEYLTNCRIDASKQLLLHSADKLADISQRVGFDDVSYFSKVFKKKTGISPSEYREQG